MHWQPSCSLRLRRHAAFHGGRIDSCRGTRAFRNLEMSIATWCTYPLGVVLDTVARASKDISDRWHTGVSRRKSSKLYGSEYYHCGINGRKVTYGESSLSCFIWSANDGEHVRFTSIAMTRVLRSHGSLL